MDEGRCQFYDHKYVTKRKILCGDCSPHVTVPVLRIVLNSNGRILFPLIGPCFTSFYCLKIYRELYDELSTIILSKTGKKYLYLFYNISKTL